MEPANLPADLAVGVYDEPELVVSGVTGMLAQVGHTGGVVPVRPGLDDARVDVLLCDPVGRGVQIEDYLATVTTATDAPVLVFTWGTSPNSLRRAMRSGARGVLSKTASAADLVAAVVAVHRGESLAPAPRTRSAPHVAELSTREADVLALICRGMSNLEIAEELYVSVNSVKTYVRQVYQKISVSRRAQAVAWGLAHGF
jgi:two-component system, NarL family, response regulator LiaR